MGEENCNIVDLSVVRNDYRSNATNMLEMLQQLLDTSNIDESRIRSTIDMLTQVKEKIAKCDDVIQVLLDEDAFIKDMEESANLNEDIEKGIRRAESLLDVLEDEASEAKFNGETVSWFRFWEAFQGEIHEDEEFSQGFKFACLKHRLEGWPLNMVSKLGSGDSAYNEALKLLQTTFSNKRMLVESHLNALLDLESPTSSPVSLMRFCSDFEYHVKALKAYETSIEEAGFFVAALLNKKLPKVIWDRINKAERISYWTLPEFQKALKFEIQLLNFECSQQSNNHLEEETHNVSTVTEGDDSACKSEAEGCKGSQDFSCKGSHDSCKGSQDSSCKGPHDSSCKGSQDSSKYSLICQLCLGYHHFSGCTVYKAPFQKLERAKQLQFCLICIKQDHTTEKCLKLIACSICRGNHNSLLCLNREVSKESKNETKVKENGGVNSLNNKNAKDILLCALCHGKHQFGMCNKFDTPIKKHGRAVILNLCTLCLKDTHKTSDCLKNSFCKNCGEKHNTLLCLCPAPSATQKPKKKRTRNRRKKQKQATNIPNGYVPPSQRGVKKATGYVQIGNVRPFMANKINTGNIKSPYKGNTHLTDSQIRNAKFLYQDIKPNLSKVSVMCSLCLGNHHFGVCGKFKTPVEKRVRAVQLKLCLICVNNKHSTNGCLKLQVCKYCGARHHTLLCVESIQPSKPVDEKEKAAKRKLRKQAKKEQKKQEKTAALKKETKPVALNKEKNTALNNNDPIENLVLKPVENKQKNDTALSCNSLLSSFIITSDI
ncbi:UNVERIFIED_CONTAM: hypothetical protein RMT77_014592 [Armadillidium vulgare]